MWRFMQLQLPSLSLLSVSLPQKLVNDMFIGMKIYKLSCYFRWYFLQTSGEILEFSVQIPPPDI